MAHLSKLKLLSVATVGNRASEKKGDYYSVFSGRTGWLLPRKERRAEKINEPLSAQADPGATRDQGRRGPRATAYSAAATTARHPRARSRAPRSQTARPSQKAEANTAAAHHLRAVHSCSCRPAGIPLLRTRRRRDGGRGRGRGVSRRRRRARAAAARSQGAAPRRRSRSAEVPRRGDARGSTLGALAQRRDGRAG